MEENNVSAVKQTTTDDKVSGVFNLQFILTSLILNWKWYLLSLIICVGCAMVYLRYASPVYSIISLSPTMYDKLYDGLDKARFVGVSHWKGKYVFDISAYADRLKRHYPIRACLFPEISTDVAEPRVELCDSKERNSAITQVAHSTLLQMWSRGLKQHQSDQAFILDVIRMLNGMEFYKIILTPDIYKNAVCLKKFLQSTDN